MSLKNKKEIQIDENGLRIFNEKEIKYIKSKIPEIDYSKITYKLKLFWIEHKEKNEKK